jgi:DsbC/DsbD-like thiol-disulfide interchange protein
MPTARSIAIVLCATLIWAELAAADAPHVRCQLLADVSAITPGKPFALGVLFTIDPSWHVYWKNPGDAGLPTRVSFTVPQGFSVGALQYPTPRRIEQPGGIVVFGYEDSLLLWAQVVPPADFPANFSGQFSAQVSWLVCADVCVPGKQAVALTLEASPTPSPANTELFNAWAKRLPATLADSDAAAVVCSGSVKNVGGRWSGALSLRIDWKHAAPPSPEFLPAALDVYTIRDAQVSSQGNTTRITFTADVLAGKSPAPETLEAVVGFAADHSDRRGLIVPIHLPDASR